MRQLSIFEPQFDDRIRREENAMNANEMANLFFEIAGVSSDLCIDETEIAQWDKKRFELLDADNFGRDMSHLIFCKAGEYNMLIARVFAYFIVRLIHNLCILEQTSHASFSKMLENMNEWMLGGGNKYEAVMCCIHLARWTLQVEHITSVQMFDNHNVINNNQEYSYFLLCPSQNTIKIGKSINPKTRIGSIQAQSPAAVFCISICKTPEKELHAAFKQYRRSGSEWFEADQSIVAYALEHCVYQDVLDLLGIDVVTGRRLLDSTDAIRGWMQ